ncbi:MAG: glycosyltransferase family 4 protein [Acidobacteriota bacterium]|nr:glycosyltransferase family 4 protein [Acidobacteriota bacterium]
MKIVMISQMAPYLPCSDGFRVIPANLLRQFAARHELHLISFTEGADTPEQLEWARGYCASVTNLRQPAAKTRMGQLLRLREPYTLTHEMTEHIRRLRPDILHLEGPYTASLAQAAPQGCATVLSAHDCMALRYEHFLRHATSTRERLRCRVLGTMGARFERRWYPRLDRVVVTSAMDAERLAQIAAPVRPVVIPNGVEVPGVAAASVPRRIVFTGNMSWPPNEDAAEFFVREVLPRVRRQYPQAEFWIVGSSPSLRVEALGGVPGVTVTGKVPVLAEYIATAEVYVSPLRFGAGVKNKILEAMAVGVPIVATPISLSGTPLVSGRHLLQAEGPAEIAAAIGKVFDDPALETSLAREAREEIQRHYTWECIASQFEAVYQAARG